jgi:hypothetical protein
MREIVRERKRKESKLMRRRKTREWIDRNKWEK